jgi:hypothetical protein
LKHERQQFGERKGRRGGSWGYFGSAIRPVLVGRGLAEQDRTVASMGVSIACLASVSTSGDRR